jgi:hypothetical protein
MLGGMVACAARVFLTLGDTCGDTLTIAARDFLTATPSKVGISSRFVYCRGGTRTRTARRPPNFRFAHLISALSQEKRAAVRLSRVRAAAAAGGRLSNQAGRTPSLAGCVGGETGRGGVPSARRFASWSGILFATNRATVPIPTRTGRSAICWAA